MISDLIAALTRLIECASTASKTYSALPPDIRNSLKDCSSDAAAALAAFTAAPLDYQELVKELRYADQAIDSARFMRSRDDERHAFAKIKETCWKGHEAIARLTRENEARREALKPFVIAAPLTEQYRLSAHPPRPLQRQGGKMMSATNMRRLIWFSYGVLIGGLLHFVLRHL